MSRTRRLLLALPVPVARQLVVSAHVATLAEAAEAVRKFSIFYFFS